MKHEFRSKTLAGALRQSLDNRSKRIETKSRVSIESGAGTFRYGTISTHVDKGYRYTISWSADNYNDGAGFYGVEISSFAHGSHRDSFTNSGRWTFVARHTGTIEFTIGVSRSFGLRWSSFPVTFDID